MKYTMVITWSEKDNSYIVTVPDLPGCMADGKTREEAVRNAQTVIDEWLETAELIGRNIPGKKMYV